ncbi:trichohyalin-like [Hoplias malabaricus]|uniref:trichohyalin-like n=1 Tax=Hoplias malabaricus TaxID=27720 RepID=UPI0034627ACA
MNPSYCQQHLSSIMSSRFEEQRRALCRRLQDETTTIRQDRDQKARELKQKLAGQEQAQKDMFHDLLQMDSERKEFTAEVLTRFRCEERWRSDGDEQLERRRLRKQITATEKFLKEADQMKLKNENLREALREERSRRLRAEESLREERAQRAFQKRKKEEEEEERRNKLEEEKIRQEEQDKARELREEEESELKEELEKLRDALKEERDERMRAEERLREEREKEQRALQKRKKEEESRQMEKRIMEKGKQMEQRVCGPRNGKEMEKKKMKEEQEEKERKAKEALVNKVLLKRQKEDAEQPETVKGRLAKFVMMTYRRLSDFCRQNDPNDPFQQHRWECKRLAKERKRKEEELMQQLLLRRLLQRSK